MVITRGISEKSSLTRVEPRAYNVWHEYMLLFWYAFIIYLSDIY